MKVDDDTFVNLPKLYSTLTSEDKYKNLTDLLMGYYHCHSRVYKVSKYKLSLYFASAYHNVVLTNVIQNIFFFIDRLEILTIQI